MELEQRGEQHCVFWAEVLFVLNTILEPAPDGVRFGQGAGGRLAEGSGTELVHERRLWT